MNSEFYMGAVIIAIVAGLYFEINIGFLVFGTALIFSSLLKYLNGNKS